MDGRPLPVSRNPSPSRGNEEGEEEGDSEKDRPQSLPLVDPTHSLFSRDVLPDRTSRPVGRLTAVPAWCRRAPAVPRGAGGRAYRAFRVARRLVTGQGDRRLRLGFVAPGDQGKSSLPPTVGSPGDRFRSESPDSFPIIEKEYKIVNTSQPPPVFFAEYMQHPEMPVFTGDPGMSPKKRLQQQDARRCSRVGRTRGITSRRSFRSWTSA